MKYTILNNLLRFLVLCLLILVVPSVSYAFTFTAAGDHGNGLRFTTTLDLIRAAGSEFHVAVGDNSYTNGAETTWCNAFATRGLKAILITGNHDSGESSGGNIDIYKTKTGCAFPFSGLNGNYGHQYYFDYPANAPLARFILIRPGVGSSGSINYSAGQPGFVFTQNAIDSARAAGIKWIIVGMHKNCITTGSKSCEIGKPLFDLLLSKKVDLILQGHDHNYQRSHSIRCASTGSVVASCIADNGDDGNYVKGAGSAIVITGTGGQGLYGVSTGDSEAGYFARINSNTHGATRFTVTATQLTASTLRPSGSSFVDSFTISDSGNPPPPPPASSPSPNSSPSPSPIGCSNSADSNNDGQINLTDLLSLVRNYTTGQTSKANGDFSCDGKVNAMDFVLLFKNWSGATQ